MDARTDTRNELAREARASAADSNLIINRSEEAVDLSVVIPVYNSAATLMTLVDRLLPVLSKVGKTHEIVFVEDGSVDSSWSVLRDLARQHPGQILAIQLMRNFGQHNALMCGFRHARGELIVTMDDDLQNPPEEIPKLIKAIELSGLDLVYGTYGEKKHAAWRNLGSAVVWTFYHLVFNTRVQATAFRIIRRPLLESIFSYALNFTYIDGLLAWNTQQIGEVEVAHRPRQSGRSGYSVRRLLLLSLNLFTNFSLLPLQMVSLVGVLAAFAGLGTGAYFLAQYLLSNIVVPGFASTIVAVLVLGGLQLVALGIMGEYIGRLHLNVNRKPQYVVRQFAGSFDADPCAAVLTAGRTEQQAVASDEPHGESGANRQCGNIPPLTAGQA